MGDSRAKKNQNGKMAVRVTGTVVLSLIAMSLIFSATRLRAGAVAQGSKSGSEPSGNPQNGKKLFVRDGCYECHGYEGQGSIGTGPRLGPDPLPLAAIISYVRKPAGEMPPYTDKVVSDQDLADIHAFLASLPQPPAVKSLPLLNQ